MPDHSYTVDIMAKIKLNVDLSKYKDKTSNEYQIPNIAHMKYNDKDTKKSHTRIIKKVNIF